MAVEIILDKVNDSTIKHIIRYRPIYLICEGTDIATGPLMATPEEARDCLSAGTNIIGVLKVTRYEKSNG